jgi:hypothetical protein
MPIALDQIKLKVNDCEMKGQLIWIKKIEHLETEQLRSIKTK